MTHIEFLVVVSVTAWFIYSVPAYVVASRLGVAHPGEAFVPGVGPYIAMLHSIKRSGWLCLLIFVPLVSLVFAIWLSFVIPTEHGRTRWWALGFFIPLVNVIAFYAYAFTLDPYGRPGPSGRTGSTYHVPPAGDWRR